MSEYIWGSQGAMLPMSTQSLNLGRQACVASAFTRKAISTALSLPLFKHQKAEQFITYMSYCFGKFLLFFFLLHVFRSRLDEFHAFF